jgi:Zn-dependent peptidase ImmA (M78 family)
MMDEAAIWLAHKYKTNCPFKLADFLNITVRFLDLPPGCRGYYLYVKRRRFIAISNNLTYEEQRFVCGHELGHDRKHKGIGYYFVEQNTLFHPGKFEREANMFSVSLLTHGESMQDDEGIESYYRRLGIPLEMIKYIK